MAIDKKQVEVKPLETGENSKNNQDDLVKDVDPSASMKPNNAMVIGVYIVLVAMGVGTGYLLSQNTSLSTLSGQTVKMEKTDKVAGVTDTQTFKDSAIGTIQKGGIDGEGTHKLIREGGPSQTAFLISSVIDLDQYVGKKVKLFGQTISAKKAAWLMDVGRIEIQ